MSIKKRVADKQHSWLSLVEMTGIVLSEPVLVESCPAGFRLLEKRELVEFYKTREAWMLPPDMAPIDVEQLWVNFIIENILGLKPSYWKIGSAIPERFVISLVDQRETLRPTRVLIDEDKPVMLFLQVPKNQNLNATWKGEGSWKASPTTKMERLLRQTRVEVGLLTNGEVWRIVIASPSEIASYLTWTTQTWYDSSNTLAALKELLGVERFFAGPKEETFIELVRKSRQRQLDITDQLGYQVREALELFFHELDRIDSAENGNLLKGHSLEEIYEAGVVLIMRLIFLLYAEENELLPHGNVTYDRSYGVIHHLTELEDTHRINPDTLDYSYEAYARLLGLFRLVHQGSPHPDIRVTAHGGRLFDPDRFPFLEGASKSNKNFGCLPIRDKIIRHILRRLKYAENEGHIKQWVSYRTLSVEQIGYMYEGLLDRKLDRNIHDEAIFLLSSSNHEVVAVKASDLSNEDNVIKKLSSLTGRTENTIAKLMEPVAENYRLTDPGTNDPTLLELAQPFRRLIKSNGIIRPSGLYMTAGQDRRSSGAHYTPTELTEPIVRQTLEPLVYKGEDGLMEQPLKVKTASEILDLKVSDMAMGSGAFLVQAVRYLSERLLEAWDAALSANSGIVLTLPNAYPSDGKANEHLMPGSGNLDDNGDSRAELELWAKRYVAERCIFGVDINPLAVEMAKLSIWLETLSKNRPFTFLDNTLKCGDSLIGIDNEQLSSWSLESKENKQLSLFNPKTEEIIQEAIRLRKEVAKTPVFSTRDTKYKETKLKLADKALSILKLGGDLLAASYLGNILKKQQPLREVLRLNYLEVLQEWFDQQEKKQTGFGTKFLKMRSLANELLKNQHIFHWQFEFPEVSANGGMNAIVGNPPFLGGKRISTVMGIEYNEVLHKFHPWASKNIDLCAHFFIRSFMLLKEGGIQGLLAVNSIAEGDTRDGGLEWIRLNKGTIYNAVSNQPWPGKAAVITSQVHLYKGMWAGPLHLNGVPVRNISTFLSSSEEDCNVKRLKSNINRAYQGSTLLGTGFTLSEIDAIQMIKCNPKNREVLFPYINGEELNSHPEQKPTRWVINFFDWEEKRAKEYKEPFKWIQETVYFERLEKSAKSSYKNIMTMWWLFWRSRSDLYHSIGRGLQYTKHPKGWNPTSTAYENVLVTARVSKHMMFSMIKNDKIFSDMVAVFATNKLSWFALLQSSIHEVWARHHSSTLKQDLRYSISNGFETFPLPQRKYLTNGNRLETLGEIYHQLRCTIMKELCIGLTQLYNRFHNPTEIQACIEKMRELHRRIDSEVARAYGWDDLNLDLDLDFREVSDLPLNDRLRFTLSTSDKNEILKRLLQLYKEQEKLKT